MIDDPFNLDNCEFVANFIKLSDYFTFEKAQDYLSMDVQLYRERNPNRKILDLDWIIKHEGTDMDAIGYKMVVSKACNLK